MGSGVSLGAHRPYQELMKKSFRPTSWAVGMLGASCVRSLEVTNRPRARPEVASGRRRRPRIHEELDVARHQVGVGGRCALVEDGVERQAGALQESERGDVSGRAARRQGKEVLLRLLGDGRDGAGIVGARHVVVHEQHQRRLARLGDRPEVGLRIVRAGRHHRLAQHEQARIEQQRIAVGIGAPHLSRNPAVPEAPPTFWTTIGWPSFSGQELAGDAAEPIGAAARRIGHDHLQRLVGKRPCPRAGAASNEAPAAPTSVLRRIMASPTPTRRTTCRLRPRRSCARRGALSRRRSRRPGPSMYRDAVSK